jgi:hypothetical protein
MIAPEQQILQFSWVVADLEEAARRWHATMGIGPFLVNRHLKIGEARYRGRPSSTDFSTAIAQAGPVQIELVQQHDASPSCYRDTVPEGREAMHHVAFIAGDYDAALAAYTAQGAEVASSGRFGDVRFCYVDTAARLGHMVEILEDRPAIRSFFGAIQRAAERWDRDPATLLRALG